MISLAWGGHRNGRLNSALLTIVLGVMLHPTATAQFLRMRDDLFAATGVRIGLTWGYRDFANQDRIFRERYTPGWPTGVRYAGKIWRKKAGVSVAAVPGTSNHGWALAVDISGYGSSGSRAFRWLRDHAAAYGWSWATGQASAEPWHWEYIGRLDTIPASTAPPEEGEDDMKAEIGYYAGKTEEFAVVHIELDGGYYTTKDRDDAIAIARLYGRGFSEQQQFWTWKVDSITEHRRILEVARRSHESVMAARRKLLASLSTGGGTLPAQLTGTFVATAKS